MPVRHSCARACISHVKPGLAARLSLPVVPSIRVAVTRLPVEEVLSAKHEPHGGARGNGRTPPFSTIASANLTEGISHAFEFRQRRALRPAEGVSGPGLRGGRRPHGG